jgi:hypothetical protein
MTRMTESTRTRGFCRAVIAGALGALVLGVGAMAAPALADTLGYYYDGPPVYTPAPSTTTTTTYTYTSPTYTYTEPAPPPPTYVYEHREHGPGIYLDTPILDFGIGIH